MISGGLIPRHAVAVCDMSKTSLAEGKTPYERTYGESFKGPIVPFGALVEYLPHSQRVKARIYQLERKCYLVSLLGYALIAEGRIRNLSQKTECKRSLDTHNDGEFLYLSGESQGDREVFQLEETTDDAENSGRLLVHSRRLHLSSTY